MKKENNKLTFTIRLSDETAKLCAAGMLLDDWRSRNEFIEKAIQYYAGYLSVDRNKTVLGEEIQKSVESSLKSSERRLSNQTFRVAVEMAKLQRIFAAYYQVDDETATHLQSICEREVKSMNGVLSLEDLIQKDK